MSVCFPCEIAVLEAALKEFGKDLKDLPKAIMPTFGKKFVDKDGLVSRARYARWVTQYGLHGLQTVAQGAVNKTMGEVRELKLRGGTPLNPKGCAVSLSSSDGTYVKVDGSASLQFEGVKPLTIEVWVRPRAANDFGGTIVSKYNRGRMGQFFIHMEQNGAVFFHREVAPWGLRSNVRVPAAVWSHIAVTYGGGVSKVFINGTLRGSQAEAGMAADAQTPILIGAIHDQSSPASIFNGDIDELRVWSVDRTQIELESSMHYGLTGYEYGLMAYWSFDECSGWRVRDKLGRRDATLHGSRWAHSDLAVFSYKDKEKALCPPGAEHCNAELLEKGKEKLNTEYWQRSIEILEEQIKLNKRIADEMPKVQALLDSVKMLELRDWRRGETVRKINEGNINVTAALEAMRTNLTLHEHRVTDWIDPSALHDHDHDAEGFPVELGEGVEKNHTDGEDSELAALLKELEELSASDLEKSVKLAGQGRKQRDRVKEDEDIFKRRSEEDAGKLRKKRKGKKKDALAATVPLFKRQGKKKELGTAGSGSGGTDIAADGGSQEDALAATISGGANALYEDEEVEEDEEEEEEEDEEEGKKMDEEEEEEEEEEAADDLKNLQAMAHSSEEDLDDVQFDENGNPLVKKPKKKKKKKRVTLEGLSARDVVTRIHALREARKEMKKPTAFNAWAANVHLEDTLDERGKQQVGV